MTTAPIGASLQLAQQLRSGGLRVDLYPDNDRYGRQFKYADERHIRYALLVSPRELDAGVVAVKESRRRRADGRSRAASGGVAACGDREIGH